MNAIVGSSDAPDAALYALLYLIRMEQPDIAIDFNAPIGNIDPDILVLAVLFWCL